MRKATHMSRAVQQQKAPTGIRRKLISRKQALAALLGSSAIAALAFGAGALSQAGEADAVTQVTASNDMLRFLIQAGLYVLLP